MVKLKKNQPNIDYIKFSLKTLYAITISDELAMQLCIVEKSNYTHSRMSYLVARGFRLNYSALRSAVLHKHIWAFHHSIYFQKFIVWINNNLEFYEATINE